MSIKMMAHVWEYATCGGSELLVLLALADFSDDGGENIYPSIKTLAAKARLSPDQTRRIVHKHVEDGTLILVEEGGWVNGRNRSNHYKINMQAPSNVQAHPPAQAQEGTRADASGGTSGGESTVLAGVQDDPSFNHHIEPLTEEEKAQARDPLEVAWAQCFEEPMPAVTKTQLDAARDTLSIAALIHGIKKGAENDAATVEYMLTCARNYIPASRLKPRVAGNANGKATYGNTYAVDIPGVHQLEPAATPEPPALPPPMAHDDPWAVAVAELSAVLPGSAPLWLEGSYLESNGELAGVPFYRVVMTQPRANPQWMQQQAEPAVRKKLASIFGKRIALEFTVAEMETAMTTYEAAPPPTIHGQGVGG